MSFLLNPFAFAAAGDFESIATVTVGSGGAADIEFTSIPGTYQHLQIRYVSRAETNNDGVWVQLNGNTGSNYAYHRISGDGSSATASGVASSTRTIVGVQAPSAATADVFGAGVIDVLDYASTSKNTTLRALTGFDNNGSGQIHIRSGLFINTGAITSIKLYEGSGDIAEHSTFALYGIKA